MGYAIPISKAEPILEELMNRETRDKVEDSSKVGYMGVKAADLTTEAIQGCIICRQVLLLLR